MGHPHDGAEVEDSEATVGRDPEVPRVRVGVQPARDGRREQREPLVAGGHLCACVLRVSHRLHERPACQPLRHQHPVAHRDDVGHGVLRRAGEGGGHGALGAGLVPVVELLPRPEPELAHQRCRHQPGDHRARDPQRDAERAQVREQHGAREGVLDLHRDVATVVPGRAVHLAERRRGDGGRVDLDQRLAPPCAQRTAQLRLHLAPRHRSVALLQGGERLGPGAFRIRGEQRVDRREQLPRLQRAALHAAERGAHRRGVAGPSRAAHACRIGVEAGANGSDSRARGQQSDEPGDARRAPGRRVREPLGDHACGVRSL